MSDFEKILLTGTVTILGGFVIHSASQIFTLIFIEPLQNFRKQRAEAISLLHFYSNMLDSRLRENDSAAYAKRYDKAQEELRLCMANIQAAYYSISPRRLAIFFKAIPNTSDFSTVKENLLQLSFLGSLKTDHGVENISLAKDTVEKLGASW